MLSEYLYGNYSLYIDLKAFEQNNVQWQRFNLVIWWKITVQIK